MKNITVRTQEELDKLPTDFDGRIFIEFGTPYNRAVVNRRFRCSVEARENSSVVAWGNSSVVAWGNSSVVAWENSSVVAWENSSVVARENSSVVAWGNSSVEAWENSSVVAWGNSSVVARENSSVVAWENSQVVNATRSHKVSIYGNARIVYNPRDIKEYIEHYGIEHDKKTVKLYKAVHKKDGRYVSDWDESFEYIIGDKATASGLEMDETEDCGRGIHMAHKAWCVDYGRAWEDLAILEVEAEIDGIIVPHNGTGKVRARSVTVLREVPLDECGLLGKHILMARG